MVRRRITIHGIYYIELRETGRHKDGTFITGRITWCALNKHEAGRQVEQSGATVLNVFTWLFDN